MRIRPIATAAIFLTLLLLAVSISIYLRNTGLTKQLETARELREAGQWSNAAKALDDLPKDHIVQIERAELMLAKGDLAGALALMKSEAAKGPADAHFWARYGFMAAASGDAPLSNQALTRAITAPVPDEEAATHLAQLIFRDDPGHAVERITALQEKVNEPAKAALVRALKAHESHQQQP